MASYEELHDRHVQDMQAMLPQHLERLEWSAERLAAHRRQELQLLVRGARMFSPWHRERLAGVDVHQLDETTL